jgi:tRNA pseudouridine13 synthase
MQVVASGGSFVVENVDTEQSRFEQRETVITGPMFGVEMKSPTGAPLDREREILERHAITPAMLAEYRRLIPGARRAALIWPDELQIDTVPDGLRFRFALPSGVYATTLLREFMKSESAGEDA